MERDVLIVTCAISAGIHGALAPEHFAEGAGAGWGFTVSTLLLAALAVALTFAPTIEALAAAALLLGGLLLAYGLATTTGVPLLHPEAEPVERLALATKGIEALGLAAALHLLRRPYALIRVNRNERTST
jgi:membrane-bound metal-dependent hydrolase YbcI (DUF457 family)